MAEDNKECSGLTEKTKNFTKKKTKSSRPKDLRFCGQMRFNREILCFLYKISPQRPSSAYSLDFYDYLYFWPKLFSKFELTPTYFGRFCWMPYRVYGPQKRYSRTVFSANSFGNARFSVYLTMFGWALVFFSVTKSAILTPFCRKKARTLIKSALEYFYRVFKPKSA